LYAKEDALVEVKNLLNNVPDIMQGVHRLIADNEEMKKELQGYVKEKTVQLKQRIIERKEVVNGVHLFR
ncbi:MAG TPA: hypothetical protein DDX07_03595, partial [Porphyromonadaceae bacterium]|nr:hypothetical protein [Porphyromonadaceae bacterium]